MLYKNIYGEGGGSLHVALTASNSLAQLTPPTRS